MSNISNFDRIGLTYAALEQGMDPHTMPALTHTQVMGVAKWYNVFTGPNHEEIWFSDDGNGNILTANPMFNKADPIQVRLDTVIAGQEPYAFSECDAHISVLENNETVTRMQVLLVNYASRAFEEKRGLFGRKKQVSVPATTFDGKTLQMRLAVFAVNITAFVDEAAFHASQEGEMRFGSTSFFPSGMMPNEGGQTGAWGFGTGPVKDCGAATSAFEGPDYHWAVVGGVGGDYGVVWSPHEGAPAQIGGFISYEGTLIGMWDKVEDL